MTAAQSGVPPSARPVTSAEMLRRPRWLTVMATISLITALLWLVVALLIGLMLVLVRLLEDGGVGIAAGMPMDPGYLDHLFRMGLLDAVCGVWLLAAAVAAYQCRAVTRVLHTSLAWVRIAMLVVWLVWVLGRSGATTGPVASMGMSPWSLAAMGMLELIYPVAILVVFRHSGRRRQLEALQAARSGRAAVAGADMGEAPR